MIQFIKDIPEMLALIGILLLISLPGIVLCLMFVGMMAKGIQNSRESIAKQKIFIAEQKARNKAKAEQSKIDWAPGGAKHEALQARLRRWGLKV